MKTPITLLLILFALQINAQTGIKDNIVKIYANYYKYDYLEPWDIAGGDAGEGSGCIIKDNMILTNAHVVSNSRYIMVKRAGQSERYIAEVTYIADDCDLAALTVNNKRFFEGITPLEIGELPNTGDEVAVYGFPNQNEQLTVTKGIVSAIEHLYYSEDNYTFLSCQIDAAINLGNSGGPAISNNKIAGIAFSALEEAANVGYIIPSPIINHFLDDIKDGTYNGFPGLGIKIQRMENPDMRAYYGMSEEMTGGLVIIIHPSSPALNILKLNDVILSIDDYKLANDGTVEFREKERTVLWYIVEKKFIGDKITLKVLRDKKIIDVNITLSQQKKEFELVPLKPSNEPPAYYIYNGFVFEPLTKNLLLDFQLNGLEFPSNYLYYYDLSRENYGNPANKHKQVVVLAGILADENNLGYDDFVDIIITSANGKNINNIEDLIDAIENHTGDYHILETATGGKIIIDKKKADKRNKKILKDNYIDARDRSKGLMAK